MNIPRIYSQAASPVDSSLNFDEQGFDAKLVDNLGSEISAYMHEVYEWAYPNPDNARLLDHD